jgi:Methyltransferase domain
MSSAAINSSADARSGIAAVDRYLVGGYDTVVGMSSRFAAAMCTRLMRIQTEFGVGGHVAEIGAFEGRFFIATAHALAPGEKALGMDVFTWPNAEVQTRFEANCERHGITGDRRISWKVDSNRTTPAELLSKYGAGDGRVRFFHIDGDHSIAALTKDLELATATLADGGVMVLDDMLHPGYPSLYLAVHDYLKRHPEMCILGIIDRETIVAASKFMICQRTWFKRYEERLLVEAKDYVWPMGAGFETEPAHHWCLVLSLDTRLAAIV